MLSGMIRLTETFMDFILRHVECDSAGKSHALLLLMVVMISADHIQVLYLTFAICSGFKYRLVILINHST